jgi:hypothetical protein
LERGVDAGEDGCGDSEAAEREVLTGFNESAGAMGRRKNGPTGEIAEASVLVEGEVNQVSGAGGEHGKKQRVIRWA